MAGITFQNDNWLGDAINGIDVGPARDSKIMLTAEQIKLARVKQQEEQQALEQARAQLKSAYDTGTAYEQALPKYGPTSDFTPQLPSYDASSGWSVGPSEDVDTIKLPQTWTDPAGAEQFAKDRALAAATGKQAALMGKSAKDIADAFPSLSAQSRVMLAGVPQDSRAREALQFAATGKFGETDESKIPIKNYVVTDQGGNIIGRGASRDLQTDIGGRPISLPPGASIQVAGQAEANPNVFGDQKRAVDALVPLAQKVNSGVPISQDEAERARVLIETAFPKSLVQQQQGGRNVTVAQRTTPIPDWLGRLSGLVDDYGAGKHLQPGASPVPFMGVTGSGAPPTSAVAPAPAPAAVSPDVLPANVPTIVSQGAANPAELRKEIQNTQSYANYANAIPNWNTMVAAAGAPPTNATDLNIIYAVAKLFDPGSVVREGELKLAGSTGTLGQQISALYSRLLNDKGTLSPETRANLLEQGRLRMQEYGHAWDVDRQWYSDRVAPAMGLDPTNVVPPLPEMRPFERGTARRRVAAAPAAMPTPSPAPASDYNDVDRLLGLR